MSAVFALVHGAWHRGACWSPLVTELEQRGHRCIVVDLPSDDPAAGVDEYTASVVDAVCDVREPLVLVGHSLGGLTIPLVAAKRDVALLVNLCALLPQPGLSLGGQRQLEPDMMTIAWRESYLPQQQRLEDGTSAWPVDVAADIFYHDCPEGLLPRALEALRPQGPRPMTETTPLEHWPSVPAIYVLTTEDRVVNPAWSRRAARERLGVDPVELPGGHSPFVSRPGELAAVLLEATDQAGAATDN